MVVSAWPSVHAEMGYLERVDRVFACRYLPQTQPHHAHLFKNANKDFATVGAVKYKVKIGVCGHHT
jgi:hypothetical protein